MLDLLQHFGIYKLCAVFQFRQYYIVRNLNECGRSINKNYAGIVK